jgi:hypothetical protein
MYKTDERFKTNYDRVHPQLAEFVLAAVTVYVNKRK